MAAWSSLADAYGAWTTKPRSTRVPDVARNLHIFWHVFVGTHVGDGGLAWTINEVSI